MNDFDVTDHEKRITELERSHDELRGALILAGKQVRKFRHNPQNAKVLHLLRRTLREARMVRHAGKAKQQSA